jgi:hypothetical protein
MNRKKLINVVQKFFHLREVDHNFSIQGEAPKFVLEDTSRKNQFKENVRFIAKAAKKSGDQEILTEYLINCIGMAIPGLNISHSRLGAVLVNSVPQVRFMSLFFHSQEERLTHGIQLFQNFYTTEHLDSAVKKKEERNIYTVEDIKAVLEILYPGTHTELYLDFLDMCMFDALVGNQDRHAKNWGIVEPVEKGPDLKERFAPIFDTARGFFWNYEDKRISKYLNKESMMSYIIRGIPEIATKADPKINHFDLVHQIVRTDPAYRGRAIKTLQNMEKVDIDAILRREVFIIGLSALRRHLIRTCFKLRLALLKDAVEHEEFNSKTLKTKAN